MFDNKKIYLECIKSEVHYSRIIASFRNVGGYIDEMDYDEFAKWLISLGIDDICTIADIVELAVNGKMELEINAANFLKSK